MNQLIARAMAEDFSWEKSAGEYLKAYERAIENKTRYDALLS